MTYFLKEQRKSVQDQGRNHREQKPAGQPGPKARGPFLPDQKRNRSSAGGAGNT